MQNIKNAVFGSNEAQSGQEPVSGQTGTGTTTEPYDAGNQAGAENTLARDRGGPDPNNLGPHQTSIANKLDPKVDSDGDGKPRSGPNDLETTTGPGSSSTGANASSYSTDQTGTTGEYSSTTGNPTSSYSTGQTGTTGTGGYSSTTDNPTSSNQGPHSSELANKADPRVDSDADGSSTVGKTTSAGSTSGLIGDTSGTSTTGASTTGTSSTGPSASRLGGEKDIDSGPGLAQGTNVTGGVPRPEHDTDKTGVTGIHSNDPKFQNIPQSSANESSVETRGQDRGPIGGVGAVEPSVGADPSSGQKPAQKQQGADRPGEEPTGEQDAAIKSKKAATEAAQDPANTSGSTGTSGGGSMPGEEKSGINAPSTGEGTGEKYVKTTGMAADGGDFDATKPGAGREAERLLEEKGIHRDHGDGGASKGEDGSDTLDPSGKPSMGQKIKDKLHIGKKS